MVLVTRLSGQQLVINSDMIEKIEATPDTVITLENGANFMVLESVPEVVERIKNFRSSIVRAANFPELAESGGLLRAVPELAAEEG
ncbi:MAG: flagellar FlbD family protein [Acidimicrobiaceae bacterium]|nr:flagellar FlbD family protein [Acidimicrobiaceae bacterium]